ncbi:intraflagellar transport protein 46 homolog isoform 1-T1 [Ara ararauna]
MAAPSHVRSRNRRHARRGGRGWRIAAALPARGRRGGTAALAGRGRARRARRPGNGGGAAWRRRARTKSSRTTNVWTCRRPSRRAARQGGRPGPDRRGLRVWAGPRPSACLGIPRPTRAAARRAAATRDFSLADYDYLPVSSEIKELFEYIKRYTPKPIEIEYKLQPFIPDFIPAVGDIDAFLKVPRPDGSPDNLGLLVLDEPSTKQSDPTVLSLWLTENSKQHNITQQIKVKSVENAEKNPKAIESWIESINELHRCKPPATVHYTRPMPDIETLMQEWSPEFEELLGKVGLPTAEMSCDLTEYVDMICAILDIPVYKSRIQPLHILFSVYSEFKNSQHFKPLADGKKGRSPPSNPPSQAAEAELLSFT